MEESSAFSSNPTQPNEEPLPCSGSTCDCFRVKLYGKLHFKKQLKPHLHTDPRYMAAMQKEFETGFRLEHPNLVRYIAKGEDYILTEYVDGETLKDFITSHPDYFRHREHADRFVRQLLDVVAYLHEHQVLHLDLKPSNIMMTRVGHELKLIDLGYCYTDTYTDTAGYTTQYAAPEQLEGTALPDTRTDIYAIGKILQQLPYNKRYAKAIKRCTFHDPDMRYPSISAMEHDVFGRRAIPWRWILVLLFMLGVISLFLFQQKGTNSATNQAIPQTKDSVETRTEYLEETRAEELPEAKSNAMDQHNSIETNATNQATDFDQNTTLYPNVSPSQIETPSANAIGKKEQKARKVDINALRKELQKLCLPVFNEQLAAYRDSSYKSVGFMAFNRLSSRFMASVRPLYIQLWEEHYKATNSIYEDDFYTECANTSLYFINNLYFDMMRNDDKRKYADSVYHYPPVRQKHTIVNGRNG